MNFKPTLNRLREELHYHQDKVAHLEILVKTFEKCVSDEEREKKEKQDSCKHTKIF